MEGQLKKKLIKYLLEDKVCNLVTEIFSTEGESVPAPNTEVFLRRSIIEPADCERRTSDHSWRWSHFQVSM